SAAVLLAVQGDVSAAADDSLPLGFVVLDIRPLAPCLPFAWHFTWAETCALVCALHGVSVPQRECLCCMRTVASVSYFPFLPLFSLLFLAQHTQFSAKGRAKANPHAMSSIPDELFGRWLLTTYNGQDLASLGFMLFPMRLEPDGNMVFMQIEVINHLSGSLEYRDGMLFGEIISTMADGEDDILVELEDALGDGFESGMHVFVEEAILTFSHAANTFLFVADNDSSQQ
ncbi:hypothetical protein MOQ_007603, partial [Trypanosoma cruzi marinkellei]